MTGIPEDVVREHRRFLWGLSYRMTGSAADADDVVQETFVRALDRPPADTDRPWRPWLATVAVNLSRDRLRARKREAYDGPWLPSPVATAPSPPDDAPDARYGRIESLTMAFLCALEALTPQQRAVLILRDVYDFSVRETAELMSSSEGNVKVIHHRARSAMARYDAAPRRPNEAERERVLGALARLMDALERRDEAALLAVLAEDARTVNDAGGEFSAARNVVSGSDHVSRFYLGIAQAYAGEVEAEVRELNGYPAIVVTLSSPKPRQASRMVFQIEIDERDRVTEVRLVLASRKLAAV